MTPVQGEARAKQKHKRRKLKYKSDDGRICSMMMIKASSILFLVLLLLQEAIITSSATTTSASSSSSSSSSEGGECLAFQSPPPTTAGQRMMKAVGQRNIAIVGSGIAGLTCARILQQEGHKVTLFEKSKGPGGRVATRLTPAGKWCTCMYCMYIRKTSMPSCYTSEALIAVLILNEHRSI